MNNGNSFQAFQETPLRSDVDLCQELPQTKLILGTFLFDQCLKNDSYIDTINSCTTLAPLKMLKASGAMAKILLSGIPL